MFPVGTWRATSSTATCRQTFLGPCWASVRASHEGRRRFVHNFLFPCVSLFSDDFVCCCGLPSRPGDHDDRVCPLHSFKYIAELQHTIGSRPGEKPLLIRIDRNSGHGGGKPTAKVLKPFLSYLSDLYMFSLLDSLRLFSRTAAVAVAVEVATVVVVVLVTVKRFFFLGGEGSCSFFLAF